MAAKGTSPINAVRAIYEALEPLDEASRERAVTSAMSLLGMTTASSDTGRLAGRSASASDVETPPSPTAQFERPVGLVELVQEKQPVTNAQRIALLALYRERAEGKPRFSRHDLKGYFSEARVQPPANYDRDFNNAVSEGWIHEDGDQSYLPRRASKPSKVGFPARDHLRGSPDRNRQLRSRHRGRSLQQEAQRTRRGQDGVGRAAAFASQLVNDYRRAHPSSRAASIVARGASARYPPVLQARRSSQLGSAA